MSKNLRLFLLILLFASAVGHAETQEVETLKHLIEVTQENLDKQQAALLSLERFQQAKAAFVADPDNARLGTRLVKSAMHLYRTLEDDHLTHLFSPDFVFELQFFNQVGEEQLISSRR